MLILRIESSSGTAGGGRNGNWHVVVDGILTFASVPKLARIPAGTKVFLDLAVDFVDHAAFEALHGWRLNHEIIGVL